MHYAFAFVSRKDIGYPTYKRSNIISVTPGHVKRRYPLLVEIASGKNRSANCECFAKIAREVW